MALIQLPEPAGQVPCFGAFAATWVAQMRPQWKASYLETVECTLRGWLLPTFAHWPLDRIDRAALLQFRAAVAAHPRAPSPARINKILAILKTCLGEGARQYGLDASRIELRPLRERRRDIHPLSLAEVERLLSHATGFWRDYYTTRIYTGMRTGEIDGLKWKFVDFERKQILIRETIVNSTPDTPKTGSSEREIDMVPLVVSALERQRERTQMRSPYVFCSRNGQPLRHGNVRRRIWLPLLERAGLSVRRPYETRHTYATLMLAAGENPEYIRRQMGHADAQMLFHTYSRYVPNLTRRDGEAFCRMIGSHAPDRN